MQIKKTLLLSILFNLFIHNAWGMELDVDTDKNLLSKQLTSSSKQENTTLNTGNEKPVNPRSVLMSSNRLEALKNILQIPTQFVIDNKWANPYHRGVELEILSEMIESLESFIFLLKTTTSDLKSVLCMRNRFVEHAARYMLYSESTLNYYDEAEEHGVFDAIKVVQNLSPSLSLEKCRTAPLDREETTDGLCVPAFPPLGFSSIFRVLLIMDGFATTFYQEGIHDLRVHLKCLKQIRSYFNIDEHLRVTLPLIEGIGNFVLSAITPTNKQVMDYLFLKKMFPLNICDIVKNCIWFEYRLSNDTELQHMISKFENLLVINEKIPYKLQKVDPNQVKRAQKILQNSEAADNHAEALKKLAHSLTPWVDLRNLALLGIHATPPWFQSILFLPKNKVILSESLPMIVKEFSQLIPFIEQVIETEIGAVLQIPTNLLTIPETPPFPSIALLSKYGSDTAYLHKIKKVLKHIDLTSDLPMSVILRLIEILGEASKNISSTLKSLNPIFWGSLEDIRDSGQHGISFQKKLVKTLTNETELIPILLKDFEEVLYFSQEIMSALPQNLEDLKYFYNNPLVGLKIKGRGISKLIGLVAPFSLTSKDCDTLRMTIQSYKGVEEHRFFVESFLEGDIIASTVSQTEFFSHVDALTTVLSGNNKKRLKEAYKTLRLGKLLGKSEDEHNTKIENLKAHLKDIKNLSPQELSTAIDMLIQEIRRYSKFAHLKTKLEGLGISNIEVWEEKWNKTQKKPSNSQTKEKENTKNKAKVIKDSLGASGEIIKHFSALNQVLGGCPQRRTMFKDKEQRSKAGCAEDHIDYKILLSSEHHVTMIRHYVGVIQEAHNYLKRHDIADPFFTAISELCWVLGAKLKDICLIGNSIAHLHDVTHENEIKIGEYSYHFINYSNITLYLDGRSCDCINCRGLPPSPYKTSLVEELTLYKTVIEKIISVGTENKQVTDYWFLKQIFPLDTVKKCTLLQLELPRK